MKFSKTVLLTLCLLSAMLVQLSALAQEITIYSESFESSNGGYRHKATTPAVPDQWQWGSPLAGPSAAHSGSYLWGTNLEGEVPRNHDAMLISPAIQLPALAANERMRVRFWAWISIDGMRDRGEFLVSKDTVTWVSKSQMFYNMSGVDGWVGFGSPGWHSYVFDVSEFAGGPIYLAFRLYTESNITFWANSIPQPIYGLYVDDISISKLQTSSRRVLFSLEAWEDPSSTASCPWVAPWGGARYSVDNDVFSTARSSDLKYRDYYRLRNPLVENNGIYSIQYIERDREKSWTDYVALKVIDHPSNSRIEVDDKGKIAAITSPDRPTSALDENGIDVLDNIADQRDGKVARLYHKDFVELTFANSSQLALGARLVIEGTGFVDGEAKQIAEPFGQPSILVQTRDADGTWTTRGKWWPRWQQSSGGFDLTGFLPDPQGEAKIRLVSISCNNHKYHALDWAALDAGIASTVTIQDAALVNARLKDRADVAAVLNSADGNSLFTQTHDWCTLSFAIPPKSGDTRDFVFVAEGYYLPDDSGGSSYFIYTWDGGKWVQRDGATYPGTDAAKTFDLTSFLPDPNGEYKVRVWQDYWYNPAEIDFTSLKVVSSTDTTVAPIDSAFSYENGQKTDIKSLVQASDDVRVKFDIYQATDVARDRWIGVSFKNLNPNTPPVVSDLNVGSPEPIYAITNPNPPISWTYSDAEGNPQSQAQIQVWTQAGGSGESMWDTLVTTTKLVTYAGKRLNPGSSYVARVRANDGIDWSAWTEVLFGMYSSDLIPPVIVRTQATINLGTTPQVGGQNLTIAAQITDNVGVTAAELYYRTVGSSGQFTMVTMTLGSNSVYSGVIPATAVIPPGVQYYILARDQYNVAYSPKTNPSVNPYDIAVQPNVAPLVYHTPITQATPSQDLMIVAKVRDITDYVQSVTLFYRPIGNTQYAVAAMTNVSDSTYSAVIPSAVIASPGIEYYIRATDNYGLSTYAGRYDEPYQVSVVGGPPKPKVTQFRVGAPEDSLQITTPTPIFSWTYYDSLGAPQTKFQIQVWTDSLSQAFRIWDTGEILGDSASMIYSGTTLSQGFLYWAFIRVYDGIFWSDWARTRFMLKSPAPPWAFRASTGRNASIAVPASINPRIGTQPLRTGDAVGVFFVRNDSLICAGYSLWEEGQNMGITAWGDDDQTQIKDGFAEGELIRYKIWDAQLGREYPATVTYAAGPGPNYVTDGIYVLASLVGVTSIDHGIILPQGWNMISSFVAPRDSTLDTMLVKVRPRLVIMKNGAGQVYWPQFSINQIGKWNPRHGYHVYMQTTDTVTITGTELDPQQTPIALVQGWNLTGYLRNSQMRTDSALTTIADKLLIAKNGAGQVYWPELSINQIGNMKPGQGYQMYLTQAGTLTYPVNSGPAPPSILTKQGAIAGNANIPSPVHYRSSMSNTGANAILLVESSDLKDGDEVGVWTGKKMLVGSGVVDQGKAVITIWGDNSLTENVVEGAVEGETLSLTAWSATEKKEQALSIFSVTDALAGEQSGNVIHYKTDAVWIARGVREAKEIPTAFSLSQNYPNPFNPSTTIKYGLPEDVKVTLEVFNVLGQRVAVLVDEEQKAGYYEVQFRNENLATGLYFYRLMTGSIIDTKKMLVVR